MKVLVLSIMTFFSVTSVVHTYYVGYQSSDTLLRFWIPVIGMAMISLYAIVRFRSAFPMLTILILSATFHLMPYVRQPSELIWYSDPIFALQLVNNIIESGHLNFGVGTGATPFYSYYPLFYLSQSMISIVPNWSAVVVLKYSMSILNLLTLVTFYLLLRKLFNEDYLSTNLIVWLYSLNPMFHAFNSQAHAESFAIMFYPLILMYSLWRLRPRGIKLRGGAFLLMVLFLLAVSLSHHFTSYMVVLSLVLPIIFLYPTRWKIFKLPAFLMLSAILPLVWLVFVANLLFLSHIRSLALVLQNLIIIHQVGEYSPVAPSLAIEYYPSELAREFSEARNVIVMVLALVGLAIRSFRKNTLYTFFGALLLAMSSLTFISLYGVRWGESPFAVVRTRIVEFSYFPIAFFAGQAVYYGLQKIKTQNMLRRVPTLLLVVAIASTFAVATVFSSFPRYIYDDSYVSTTSSASPLSPEEHYIMSMWVGSHLANSKETVFAGSRSAHSYVVGYGLFAGLWASEFDPNATEQVHNKPNLELFYVVNHWQMTLPDSAGRCLSPADLEYLNGKFGRMYDDGTMTIYHETMP